MGGGADLCSRKFSLEHWERFSPRMVSESDSSRVIVVQI